MSYQAKSSHPNYIAIRPLPVEKQPGEVLEMSEQSREKVIKKQNRGTVVLMGKNCEDWIELGDVVSFFRNAATPVPVDGEELMLVHKDHIMVKF